MVDAVKVVAILAVLIGAVALLYKLSKKNDAPAPGPSNYFMYGIYIAGNGKFIPIQKTANLADGTIVYMISEYNDAKKINAVKMVDGAGHAKVMYGQFSDFDPAKWNTYQDMTTGYRIRVCPSNCTTGCDVSGKCMSVPEPWVGPPY